MFCTRSKFNIKINFLALAVVLTTHLEKHEGTLKEPCMFPKIINLLHS
jgi:hypothetical protein